MVVPFRNRLEGIFLRYYLAIDLGASSGRHIVGWQENGSVQMKEVYRFANATKPANGSLTWDIDHLFREVKNGIRAAFEAFGSIQSLSIDTWGVDYVLMQGDQEVLPCFAYRDNRTEAAISEVHSIIGFSELYRHTGCQFQPFTTIYQLYTDKLQGRLEGVTDFLMMPEYLMYKLTGVKAKEYTHATTTGLINAETGDFDKELLSALELPAHLFPTPTPTGSLLGTLLPEVAAEVGGSCDVVFCATHDTASAVEGIPMEGNAPYISSGTWSLLGIKTPAPITNPASEDANYSNEGGVGYNRYQKNIMGLWLVQSLQKELCPDMSFPQIVEEAQSSSCDVLIDANDPMFLSPDSMKDAFDRATGGRLTCLGDYFRCAYRSLAQSYDLAIRELEANTGCSYSSLYIVGGGAKNAFLNRLTEEATGKQVIALPIEATALGNLLVQMRRS